MLRSLPISGFDLGLNLHRALIFLFFSPFSFPFDARQRVGGDVFLFLFYGTGKWKYNRKKKISELNLLVRKNVSLVINYYFYYFIIDMHRDRVGEIT